MFGVEVESLNVYLITNSSIFDIPVKNISGNHGNYWRYVEIDINIDTIFKVCISQSFLVRKFIVCGINWCQRCRR